MTPRIDLHRHLDGNIRTSTILDLAEKNGIRLPASDEDSLRPHVTITSPAPGLMAFLEKFHWPMAVLSTPEDCHRIAYENVEDAKRERLTEVELRFSPLFMARAAQLDPAEVAEAVVEGIAAGERDFGVPACPIGILSRTFGPTACLQELDALLSVREKLAGMDLAGDEARFPAKLFTQHFEKVRRSDLRVTIHAGEADGPGSIRDAINLLGATRIGHGVSAIQDPALLDELADRGIGLECCLTSNIQTSTVASYADHPLRRFLEHGILATINTDDPGISGITLDHEYETAAPLAGLLPAQIEQARQNASTIAWRSGQLT